MGIELASAGPRCISGLLSSDRKYCLTVLRAMPYRGQQLLISVGKRSPPQSPYARQSHTRCRLTALVQQNYHLCQFKMI